MPRPASQVVGEMGFFFGLRHSTQARAPSHSPATLFALPKADFSQLVKLYPDQEEQITKNIIASWDVQRRWPLGLRLHTLLRLLCLVW